MSPLRMNTTLKIVLIACLLGTLVGLFFANRVLTKTAQQTATLKADVVINQKQLEVYEKTKTQVESLSYVEDLVKTVLPDGKDQSAVVAELSEFAKRSGLSVSQITFPETAASSKSSKAKSSLVVPKGVNVVPVTVQLAAGSKYENLLTFLKTLEDTRRKTQVTNIALTPDADDRSKLSEVTIVVNLYTKKQTGGS